MIVRNVGLSTLFYAVIGGLAWPRPTPTIEADALPDPEPPFVLKARSKGGVRLLRPSDALWFRAAGNYAEAVTRDGAVFLVDQSLAELERKLCDRGFARVHRTAIVRLDSVEAIVSRGHGDADLLLEDGTRVRMSRRYRTRVAHLKGLT